MPRKQKLNAPYKLSGAAQDSLFNRGVEKATSEKTVASANKKMANRSSVSSVEDAKEVAHELGEVNKKLRAARRPR